VTPRTLVLAPLLGVLGAQGYAAASPGERTRLVVLTDISSLTPGQAEPDDGQSLIRLMLYTNELEVDGLCATATLGKQRGVRPELIGQVVDAYARVEPNLLRHDGRFPKAAELRRGIKVGQPHAGPDVPVAECVGAGKDTEASQWLIAVVDRPDPRPVWVTIWGGSADLAQALWKVRQGRNAAEASRFVERLRVHAIADQDSTGPWIRENFPGLFLITNRRAMRGMYRGGDETLTSPYWVAARIKGRGPLGALYPDYNGGDIWARTLGPVRGIKEGDTPSFLFLLPNGLGDPERPWLGSWGGRFEGGPRQFADVPDTDIDTARDPDPRMATVYRWRPAFQADFEARLAWCVTPYAAANHPPVVQITGARDRTVEPGAEVVLDAGASHDPDGDPLDFAWSVYPPRGEGKPAVTIADPGARVARLVVPDDAPGSLIPVLLSVTDGGRPRLARYGRVLITVGRSP
jgi:hypothetical protein